MREKEQGGEECVRDRCADLEYDLWRARTHILALEAAAGINEVSAQRMVE